VTAGFIPPDHWGEVASQLGKNGSVTLDGNGKGAISFSPDNANQRWVVTTVIVNTNQPATATVVPYATGALNTTDISQMSPGNQLGTSYDGNNDTFGGQPFDVGPVDFYSVLFYPPPGQSGTPLAGVIATAIVKGTKYTRRS
jgi:hypothetical protein